MNTVTEDVDALHRLVAHAIDPQRTADQLDRSLDLLRQRYQTRPEDFTAALLQRLRELSGSLESMRALRFLIEDADGADSQAYARETANELLRVSSALTGTKLAALAVTQARNLRDRLPSLSDTVHVRDRHHESEVSPPIPDASGKYAAWQQFAALAPLCPKCNAVMTLRKSRRDDFWGCQGHPMHCDGTFDLTPAARCALESLRSRFG